MRKETGKKKYLQHHSLLEIQGLLHFYHGNKNDFKGGKNKKEGGQPLTAQYMRSMNWRVTRMEKMHLL